jgi:hypothetical protein
VDEDAREWRAVQDDVWAPTKRRNKKGPDDTTCNTVAFEASGGIDTLDDDPLKSPKGGLDRLIRMDRYMFSHIPMEEKG